jgi:hypothetical protein
MRTPRSRPLVERAITTLLSVIAVMLAGLALAPSTTASTPLNGAAMDEPYPVVEGLVTDAASGDPVADIRLRFYQWVFDDDEAAGGYFDPAGSTATGAAGRYSVALWSGTWFATVPSGQGYLKAFSGGAPARPLERDDHGVFELATGTSRTVDFVLQPVPRATGVATGRVVEAGSGYPVEDISVRFVPASDPALAPTVVGGTYDDGTFRVRAAPGSYRVRFIDTKGYFENQSRAVTVAAGEVTEVGDVVLQWSTQRVSVSGVVVGADGASPVAGAEVRVLRLRGTGADARWTEGEGYGATTDDRGRYTLPYLAPGGTYTVVVSAPGMRTTWLGNAYTRATAERFLAAEGRAVGKVRLLPANRVSGAVTYDGRRIDPAVDLYRWAPARGQFVQVSSYLNYSGGTPPYTFSDLRPGHYTLRFGQQDPVDGFTVKPWGGFVWLNGEAIAPAGPGAAGVFEISNWENETHDIDLAARLVPARGRVLVDGAGLGGAFVNLWLWDAEDQEWTLTNYDGYYDEPRQDLPTRADGTFELALPKGITIAWMAWKPGYTREWRGGIAFPTPPAPGVFDTSDVSGTLQLGPVTVQDIRLLATSRPKVTGSPVVGQRLATTNGTWNKADVWFTYRWLRDGVGIPNATHRTYTVRPGDRGHRVSARVIAHLAGWYNGTAVSNALLVLE